MKIKMEEVGEYLVENDLKTPENVKKVKDMTKEIYGQHRDMLKFVNLLNFFFQISISHSISGTSMNVTRYLKDNAPWLWL